ncbi:hypothetical protein Clacol_002728 [Clathrus columnatus]|uniref:Uncharacterized protein n=1 Tax=Clathrus columnatus TaxID=1419009 RepID=A0AAV5A6B8_9AGAM|nr:hypothetical protein Clacol_002728 [Clathrus columnatus]
MSVPALAVYAVSMAVLKYRNGYSNIPGHGSSLTGMAGLPLTAILTRTDPLKAEAYLFLVGSLSSFTITAFFLIVLAEFPKFLRRVKKEGAATPVILRLVKFHELNIMDWYVTALEREQSGHSCVLSQDLLAFLAAVGTIVSSTMTLLIFFPRSLAEDSNWCPQSIEAQSHHTTVSGTTRFQKPSLVNMRVNHAYLGRRVETLNPFTDDGRGLGKLPSLLESTSRNPNHHSGMEGISPSPLTTPYYPPKSFAEEGCHFLDNISPWSMPPTFSEIENKKPKRLSYVSSDESGTIHPNVKTRLMELGEVIDKGMKRPSRPPRLHPYITSFISPIDLPSGDEDLAPRAI